MHGGVRISYMHFSFAWLANLGHASWHLKETVACTGVYRVNALTKLWLWRHKVNSTIFTGKGDADTGPSTGTVDAQAPVFTRVQQARISLQWLMIYKHDH